MGNRFINYWLSAACGGIMTNDKYEDSEITEDEFLDIDDLCWDISDYDPLWMIKAGFGFDDEEEFL